MPNTCSDLYPNAKYVPADKSNYKVGRKQNINLIVIHITSGRAKAEPVVDMWKTEKNHGSSAHFVIGQAGETYQAIKISDTAWHTNAANGYSVGIEHSAREPKEPSFPKGDPGLPVSETQYQKSAELVAWLLKQLGLPADRDHIKGHCEADKTTTHTNCPNSIWDWNKYMELVKAEYSKL